MIHLLFPCTATSSNPLILLQSNNNHRITDSTLTLTSHNPSNTIITTTTTHGACREDRRTGRTATDRVQVEEQKEWD